MLDEVKKLWPELEWIKDAALRQQTAETWAKALERSPLTAADLEEIPFTLLVKDLKVSWPTTHRLQAQVMAQASGLSCRSTWTRWWRGRSWPTWVRYAGGR